MESRLNREMKRERCWERTGRDARRVGEFGGRT